MTALIKIVLFTDRSWDRTSKWRDINLVNLFVTEAVLKNLKLSFSLRKLSRIGSIRWFYGGQMNKNNDTNMTMRHPFTVGGNIIVSLLEKNVRFTSIHRYLLQLKLKDHEMWFSVSLVHILRNGVKEGRIFKTLNHVWIVWQFVDWEVNVFIFDSVFFSFTE